MNSRISFWIFFSVLFQGCTTIESLVTSVMKRSPESGYGESSQRAAAGMNSLGPTPWDETLVQLKHLESKISGRRELDQYSKVLPLFESNQEKIQFLEIPDYESRQSWLISRNFSKRSKSISQKMQATVEAKDIAIGMTESLVRKSWGEPQEVSVSGMPEFRNQKWKYQKQIPTQDGYKLENKILYFEGGRVIGWETE